LLDGSRLISKDKRALSDKDSMYAHLAGFHEEESGGGVRHTRSVNMLEAGFIQYLDTGIWHLAFYNDGRNTEQVSYNTIVIGRMRVWVIYSLTESSVPLCLIQLPARCCVVGMATTPVAAASATVGGKAPSVTSRPTSALTSTVEDMASA
ncbi:hypothetical protein GOODEAATRI_025511, partial [Goodea atripinnis]